jgi:hypothetical protein
MRTKISLALGPSGPLSRQTAWGCLTTNLTLPGFGSLLGGRVVGYAQIAISMTGFALTTIFGVRFMVWYFSDSAHLLQIQADPDVYFHEVWLQVRWAFAGMGLFLVAWLWALASSLGILEKARAHDAMTRPLPPRINP